MKRRGFTLQELLIALILAGIVGTLLVKTLTSMQRTTGSQAARVDAAEAARAATYYISSVLREVDASEGDFITANATTLRYRAPRWTGISCTGVTTSGANLLVTLKKSQIFSFRDPSPTLDSLLVFDDVTTSSRSDDVWLYAKLVDTVTAACPDASAGLQLTLIIAAASGGNTAATSGFTLGSPIRGFQEEELSLYNDGVGNYWLGQSAMSLAGTWTAVAQIAGPLTSNGVSFAFYDTLNSAAATNAAIASVGLTVRSQSQKLARGNSGNTNLRDSIITRVALRNNKRF
ncbi:MAG TPA: type II secretion system protein [Gemmatimonadaceae bacterium]|nr:type II secretion system protein [Gemmatimonadaceae bacterium]